MPRSLAVLAACGLLQACAAYGPANPRSDEVFARVRSGMTQQEVRALAGPPDNAMAFPLSHTTSWGYFYFDTWGYYCEFSVTFAPDGLASSKISRRVNDGGDYGK